jgi:protein-tyrosine phosphatase
VLKKVLIVCIGNICRSPTAEILLRDRLKDSDVEVRSAGIAALVGGSIEPTARKLLAECEPLEIDHKGKQLTPECVKWADLILVMERKHISAVLAIAPEARGKVVLLGKWQEDREISDPYRQGEPAFKHAKALIEEAVNAWAQRLVRC